MAAKKSPSGGNRRDILPVQRATCRPAGPPPARFARADRERRVLIDAYGRPVPI